MLRPPRSEPGRLVTHRDRWVQYFPQHDHLAQPGGRKIQGNRSRRGRRRRRDRGNGPFLRSRRDGSLRPCHRHLRRDRSHRPRPDAPRRERRNRPSRTRLPRRNRPRPLGGRHRAFRPRDTDGPVARSHRRAGHARHGARGRFARPWRRGAPVAPRCGVRLVRSRRAGGQLLLFRRLVQLAEDRSDDRQKQDGNDPDQLARVVITDGQDVHHAQHTIRLQQASAPGRGPESRAYFFSSPPPLRLIESRIDVSA